MRQQNPETPRQEGTGIVNTSSFSDARTPHFREVFLFSGKLQKYSPRRNLNLHEQNTF